MKCCYCRTVSCHELITELRNVGCASSTTQRIHGVLASILDSVSDISLLL